MCVNTMAFLQDFCINTGVGVCVCVCVMNGLVITRWPGGLQWWAVQS